MAFDLTFPAAVQPDSRCSALAARIAVDLVAFITATDYLVVSLRLRGARPCPVSLPNIVVQGAVRDLGLKVDVDQAAWQGEDPRGSRPAL